MLHRYFQKNGYKLANALLIRCVLVDGMKKHRNAEKKVSDLRERYLNLLVDYMKNL